VIDACKRFPLAAPPHHVRYVMLAGVNDSPVGKLVKVLSGVRPGQPAAQRGPGIERRPTKPSTRSRIGRRGLNVSVQSGDGHPGGLRATDCGGAVKSRWFSGFMENPRCLCCSSRSRARARRGVDTLSDSAGPRSGSAPPSVLRGREGGARRSSRTRPAWFFRQRHQRGTPRVVGD
jgi:hypothetical protein